MARVPDFTVSNAAAGSDTVGHQEPGDTRLAANTDRIRLDFRPGAPDISLFPSKAWVSGVRDAARCGIELKGYEDRRGHPLLRSELARRLGRVLGVAVRPEQILVTGGFADGLALAASALNHLGLRAAAVEDPCLATHRQVLTRAGLLVHKVPVDGDGLDVTALAATSARVALVTPTHQFPMGMALSDSRRRRLLEWARRVDGYVIEDDYDGEYRFDPRPPGPLYALDPSRVIYGGTTSKTLSPDLRLGWLVLPPRLASAIIDGVPHQRAPTLNQMAFSEMLREGHYSRHLRRTKQEYQRRREHLLAAGISLEGISAGLHGVLLIPDEGEVIESGRQRGLVLMGTRSFWHGPPRHHGLVIGYGRPTREVAWRAMNELIDHIRPRLTPAGPGAIPSGRHT
ncbi:PLP-dependent aminotransferase family protein [Streptomyces zhihengii]|uniref:aminotransferase-like domain-containing protein n=1 Tax=Streptomyces zhihengii TaxID=1818004 RepID=UPI0033A52DAC